MSKKYISLKKVFYGTKGVLDTLNENFQEFKPKAHSLEKFFKNYNRYFYDLKKATHRYFLKRSMNYAYPGGYISPTNRRINNLRKELKDIQRKIDSEERHHFFIKNNSFMMDVENINLTSGGGFLAAGQTVYYIHSGKKRKITNFQVYKNLKIRAGRHESIAGKNFIIFVDNNMIQEFTSGPDINNMSDANISFLEVNIYPQTLDEYENIDPVDIEDNLTMTTQLTNKGED